MVRRANATFAALTALVALTALSPHAAAESIDDGDDTEDDSPTFNMFGFHGGVGALPFDGAVSRVISLGLALEHPVFTKTRVLAEYDWLWLMRLDPSTTTNPDSSVMRPHQRGTGHRASLGLRRELFGKGRRGTRAFMDGELGVSVALVNYTMSGVDVAPAGFAGLRAGYDLYSSRDDSPSRTFEIAVLVRAIALRDGAGMTMGIGMFWGN